MIGVIKKEFQPMRLKTSFDVLHKQFRESFLCLLEVWLSNLWLNFEIWKHLTTESKLLEEDTLL